MHLMRQLPTESIDLIYMDPPFFSGRQYNVIFGDQNELRSFSDIWEGGMPGYLIWLNARLYEMKRLLKKAGSVYVHCDWHASHYLRVEMDKIFRHENFQSEIILAEAPPDQFRGFVLKCFGAVGEKREARIHGYKGAIPVWVRQPKPKNAVPPQDVQDFANAIHKTIRFRQDNLRDGIMLAWAFRPDAMEAAERLRRPEQTDLYFVRLETIRIDSPRFREHVSALSTDHADYENFLTFVQPPKIEVGFKRIAPRTYLFDGSETLVTNPGAKMINVQWDFDYGKRFSSTPGYSFSRTGKKEVALQSQYEFSTTGKKRIACEVQDDMGGEALWTAEIQVE